MKKVIAFAAVAMFSAGAFAADGEAVYNKTCATCHTPAMAAAMGAPAAHDVDAWAPRIANGVDAAVASAKAGKNAMPPMGTCMDCSDEDLKAAIEFMSSAK